MFHYSSTTGFARLDLKPIIYQHKEQNGHQKLFEIQHRAILETIHG